jgi:hypothetical protein
VKAPLSGEKVRPNDDKYTRRWSKWCVIPRGKGPINQSFLEAYDIPKVTYPSQLSLSRFAQRTAENEAQSFSRLPSPFSPNFGIFSLTHR